MKLNPEDPQISKKEWQALIAMLEYTGDTVEKADPFAFSLIQVAVDYMKERLVGPAVAERQSMREN